MNSDFKKAGILTLVLVLTSIGSWEFYLRSRGVSFSFDDNEALWAYKRSQIYDSQKNSTFFIGASRIKFDLDIPTWESITGEKAIQLALVGTSPQLILKNLSEDKNFKGKLIIDITEFAVFTRDPDDHTNAKKSIEYYNKLTPAQWASFHIDHLLESQLVFLETKVFSLNALLSRRLHLANRKGIGADINFPIGFEPAMFNRQNVMSERFLADTAGQRTMKNYWTRFGILDTAHGITGDTLQTIFNDIKINIDKIKARGGQIIFVRPPSSGAMREAEKKAYPKEDYWDKLLTYTNTPGIYFEDYPEMTNFICPEWSHLAPKDAVTFTTSLIRILENKYGWQLSNKKTTALNTLTLKTFNHGF